MAQTLYSVFIGRNRPGILPMVTDAELGAFFRSTVARHFSGFSVSEVIGFWEGKEERSVRVDIIADRIPASRAKVSAIAADARERFTQTAVLWSESRIDAFMVDGPTTFQL